MGRRKSKWVKNEKGLIGQRMHRCRIASAGETQSTTTCPDGIFSIPSHSALTRVC